MFVQGKGARVWITVDDEDGVARVSCIEPAPKTSTWVEFDAEGLDRLAQAAAHAAANLRPSAVHFQRPENGRIACGDVSGLFAWGIEHVTCPACIARVGAPKS